MQTVLTFRDKSVIISPTYGMGEAVEGYYVTESDHRVISFDMPYTASPEDEWKALSDYGKNKVREEGWTGVGYWENAVAAGLQELGVIPGSSELEEYLAEQKAKFETESARARGQLEKLLAGDKEYNGQGRLKMLVQSAQELRSLVEVVESLPQHDPEGLKNAWSDWPVPDVN